jgi:predicted CXXCH cytochrome family protein
MLTLALATAAAHAQPAPTGQLLNPPGPANQRPTVATRNCTTSGCHADQLNHKLLHGPTAVGACDVCHQLKDPAQHTFQLKREGRELCSFCHVDRTAADGPVVHKPVADGACVSCHNPHGSDVKPMLRQNTLNAQCLQCHTQVMQGSHAHKPANESCTACHQAHSAPHQKLLRVQKDQLCVTCHAPVQQAITSAKHPHQPVAAGDCYLCHSPHASNAMAVLKQEPQALCLSCHKPIADLIGKVAHPHSAVSDAKACLNCHTPHGSDHAKQLKSSTLDACMACHDKPIQVSQSKTVAAVNELRVDAFHKHGPINKDDCGACHTVHGGQVDRLLVARYSETFYINKEPDAVALCFKCHDARLLSAPVEGRQTAFRDGDRNLHAVHVGQGPGQQARTCRACHTVHASRFENMVADSVKFGEWALPVNYTKTPTGGSCSPGCHKAQPYDREVPGRAPPPTPPSRDEPPVAPDPAKSSQPAAPGR